MDQETAGSAPRDPNSPMQVVFADFEARCRHYLYTWIPRVLVQAFFVLFCSVCPLGGCVGCAPCL